ncbi:zinc finger protein mex-5-related [Anaeramoeba flamelloides]|uniref:Zinc finger protein mex-5-related n=1 Tax=Anaeramoeba flamelloides TaxID=1746091 RepID=A0AAV7ZJD2_9EUKA|nr:zinc finger protein mex-5-related [Anaeramoeba flamelloides]
MNKTIYDQQSQKQTANKNNKGKINIGSTTIMYNKNDPRLYTVPCKYWSLGTCKMGEKCRFLHGNKLKDDPRRPEYKNSTNQLNPKTEFQLLSRESNSDEYEENNNFVITNRTFEKTNNIHLNEFQTNYTLPFGLNSQRSTNKMIQTEISKNDHNMNTNLKMEEEDSRKVKNIRFKLTPDEIPTDQLINRYGRKPFLELNVLYSNEKSIVHYSNTIRTLFIDNGIDVHLNYQMEFGKIIKTENLSKIISQSIADFIVVIGDRNLKNHTCQVRRKRKLVEMHVEDVIEDIWYDWEKTHQISETKFGFKIPKNHKIYQNSNVKNDKDAHRQKLFILLARHTNLGDIDSKITKLSKLFSTFLEYSKLQMNGVSNLNSQIPDNILLTTLKNIELFQKTLKVSKHVVYQIKSKREPIIKKLRDKRGHIATAGFFPKNKKPKIPIKLKKELLEIINQTLQILNNIKERIAIYQDRIKKLQYQSIQLFKNNNNNNYDYDNKSVIQNNIQISIERFNNNYSLSHDHNHNHNHNNNNMVFDENVDHYFTNNNRSGILYKQLKQQFEDFLEVMSGMEYLYSEYIEDEFVKSKKTVKKKKKIKQSQIQKPKTLSRQNGQGMFHRLSQPSFTLLNNYQPPQTLIGNLSTGNLLEINKKNSSLSSHSSMGSFNQFYNLN